MLIRCFLHGPAKLLYIEQGWNWLTRCMGCRSGAWGGEGEAWRYEIEGLWSRLSSISNVDSKVGYQCGELWEEVKDGRR